MNPLPNRPLVTSLANPANQQGSANPLLPLALPNVPSFEQMTSSAYNGRPRKVLPEGGKEFPSMLSGMNNMMSGPSSTPAPSGPHGQMPPLERPNPHGSTTISQPQPAATPPGDPPSSEEQDSEEPRQLTAIFRPDDAGEWRERLRLMHEASLAAGNASPGWEKGGDEDGKDEEIEEDEEEALDEQSESSDDSNVWKAKRTLRK